MIDRRHDHFSGRGDGGWSPPSLIERARRILEIAPGERPLVPDFGCRIHSLSELRSDWSRHVAASLLEEALDRWAPGLAVDRAEIEGVEGATVDIALRAAGSWHRLAIRLRRGDGEGPGQ